MVIDPKADRKEGSPLFPGDSFKHEDAPFRVTVAKKRPNGSYLLEIEIEK